MQQNYITRDSYKGKNEIILSAVQESKNYKKGLWLTFLQAKSLDCRVKKGEKGVRIMKFVNEKEIGDEKKVAFRFYTVFNIEQIEKI